MPYDNTCKFIAEQFSADIASWLLGESVALTQLEPSELSLEPIRADALILLQSQNIILHCEFQTNPDPNLPFRSADYRLRGYRRFPNKPMRQVVVYLRKTQSPLVYQTTFELATTRHTFEVIRLWEQPTELFLSRPGLLPFAVLTQTLEQVEVLQTVAQQVEGIADRQQRSNLAAASSILAGLVLEKDVIRQVLRQDMMRESVIYQDILHEGEQRGLQQGLQRERSLVVQLLNCKVGVIPSDVQSQIEALPLPTLEALAPALLNFSSLDDLVDWLQAHQ
jgi:predicted transposase/invertase (TIGR01784 family)